MALEKRGDIGLSFGMIFSIILIVVILGVAFYAIKYFYDLSRCTEISIFYKDFQDRVNKAWSSEITRDEFVGSLPSGIEFVCVGDLETPSSGKQYEELKNYKRFGSNIFMYPIKKSCDQSHKKINNVDLSALGGLTCFEVQKGKVSIKIEKGSYDSLVKILK